MSSTAAEWDWCGFAHTCGVCSFCTSGRENLCLEREVHRMGSRRGYAELVTAHKDFVHPCLTVTRRRWPLLCGGDRVQESAGGRYCPQSAGARLGLYGFGASATIAIQVANFWAARSTW